MLTEIPLANSNYRLWADKGRFRLTVTGLDVNNTNTTTEPIDLFGLLYERFGPFTKGALQCVGEEASAYGNTFKVTVQVSNDGQNWTTLSSSETGAGGSIVTGIDLTGGWQAFRLKCSTAEGVACTGTAYFTGLYTN